MAFGILKQQAKPAAKPPANRHTLSKLDSQYISVLAAKGCAGCPLDKAELNSPKMPATGALHPEIYCVGEAPGEKEDNEGEQFVGPAGRLLRQEIPSRWSKKIRWNNVINCRPPSNREPAPVEVACCRIRLEEDISRTRPKLILGFGNVPLAWFTGEGRRIGVWRGRLVPVSVRGHECWYMPMLHPSYVLRARNQEEKGAAIEDVFRRDLADAFRLLDEGLEPPLLEHAENKNDGVVILPARSAPILEALDEVLSWPEYSIDIETSALRPFAAGAKILSCAISNYEKTYAFPLRHREAKWDDNGLELDQVEEALKELLLKGGKPIAHAAKFEQEWFASLYGPAVIHEADWQDTMAQAYVLDEREGAKGLEEVSIINLGLNVKALSPPMNKAKMERVPLVDLLPYNSFDAKYTYPIYWLQKERLKKEKLSKVYRMQNVRSGPIALAQIAGVQPDTAVAEAFEKEYAAKIATVERLIQKDADVIAFKKKYGRSFLPSSNKDLLELLYYELGFKECEVKTDKKTGKVSLGTDEEVLKQIDHPLVAPMLELRQYSKLLGTYVTPFLANGKHIWPDGLIHTSYNHLLTSTGRTSSEDPNLQNFPIRKDRRIRSIIVAPPGYWLAAFDFKQLEACLIAMASKCPVLTKALWEDYDIHGEWAERIALAYPRRIGGKKFLRDKEVMGDFRSTTKNQWTFPLFYGSVMESVAKGLEVPERVIAPLFEEFWQHFEGVRVWQKTLLSFYAEHGYVEALTGRRRRTPLSINEILNSGIQGAASDIVVDASVCISKMAYEKGRQELQWRLNVHDDLSFYLPDALLEEDVEIIAKEMVDLRYSFITVPLAVEVKVGKDWANMEEVGKVSSKDFR